jgi:hypothetical protein
MKKPTSPDPTVQRAEKNKDWPIYVLLKDLEHEKMIIALETLIIKAAESGRWSDITASQKRYEEKGYFQYLESVLTLTGEEERAISLLQRLHSMGSSVSREVHGTFVKFLMRAVYDKALSDSAAALRIWAYLMTLWNSISGDFYVEAFSEVVSDQTDLERIRWFMNLHPSEAILKRIWTSLTRKDDYHFLQKGAEMMWQIRMQTKRGYFSNDPQSKSAESAFDACVVMTKRITAFHLALCELYDFVDSYNRTRIHEVHCRIDADYTTCKLKGVLFSHSRKRASHCSDIDDKAEIHCIQEKFQVFIRFLRFWAALNDMTYFLFTMKGSFHHTQYDDDGKKKAEISDYVMRQIV